MSATTQRVIAGAQPKGGVVQAAESEAEGFLPSVRATQVLFVGGAVRSAVLRARQGFTNEVSDELAILFAEGLDNPAALRTLLNELRFSQRTLERRGLSAMAAAIGLGVIGGKAGAAF